MTGCCELSHVGSGRLGPLASGQMEMALRSASWGEHPRQHARLWAGQRTPTTRADVVRGGVRMRPGAVVAHGAARGKGRRRLSTPRAGIQSSGRRRTGRPTQVGMGCRPPLVRGRRHYSVEGRKRAVLVSLMRMGGGLEGGRGASQMPVVEALKCKKKNL
jgi:hypothetical protein